MLRNDILKRLREIIVLFCKDPFRLFFPLGILMGVLGVGHWAFYTIGWTKSYSGFYHSTIQMQAYMASFVIGFLLTSLPRFASASYVSLWELIVFVLWILGVWIFAFYQYWILAEFCFVGLLLTLAFFAFRRFKKKQSVSVPPVEFIWILVAILNGILGSFLLIWGQSRGGSTLLLGIGKPMVDQGFLLSIVIGVGGFLSPRLMGHFQSNRDFTPNLIAKFRRLRFKQYFSFATLLFLSFIFEGFGWKISAYAIRALVVTSMLFLTRSLPRPPKAPDMYVWMIWISMWLVFLGSWSVVLFPRYRIEMLHIIFIGGFSLMTFAVGTMVVMSHSGQAMRLRKRMKILWVIALGVLGALVFRILAVFCPRSYFFFLGIGSLFWLMAAFSWFTFMLRYMLKIPNLETFEEFHEESKKRIKEIRNQC